MTKRRRAALALAVACLLRVLAAYAEPPDRGFEDVNGELAHRVARLQAIMYLAGHPVFVVETHRSEERQAELYQQGRTEPGDKVTWTKHSRHQDGRAVDLAFEGADPWGAEHPWKLLQLAAKVLGLRGGPPEDLGHFEL